MFLRLGNWVAVVLYGENRDRSEQFFGLLDRPLRTPNSPIWGVKPSRYPRLVNVTSRWHFTCHVLVKDGLGQRGCVLRTRVWGGGGSRSRYVLSL